MIIKQYALQKYKLEKTFFFFVKLKGEKNVADLKVTDRGR